MREWVRRFGRACPARNHVWMTILLVCSAHHRPARAGLQVPAGEAGGMVLRAKENGMSAAAEVLVC